MTDVGQSSDLITEIEAFRQAIRELEEHYATLQAQSAVHAVHIPHNGTPEQILRAAMLEAELAAQRQAEQAGTIKAMQIMRSVLEQKQLQLEILSESLLTTSTKRLQAELITPEQFAPYGQVIWASEDGKAYDGEDAQLDLQHGTPRFYIMRLQKNGRRFHRITRHQRCTQCLGSLEGKEWLLAVAPPGDSACPPLEAIVAFRIPGNCFIKLESGTWHAGPYFEQDSIDFYNLELSDTNLTDHDTCDLLEHYGMECEIMTGKA